MSTIGVQYHNEDIHYIIRKHVPPTIKSPRHKSNQKFPSKSQLSQTKGYNGHQTFGLPRYEAPEAWNYLKKGKLPPAKSIDKEGFKCTIKRKSPVPKCCVEIPKREEKNFVKENIKKISSIEPRLPPPRRVETPRGTKTELAHLIQMIKIRDSEEYGKIPKYLCDRKRYWTEKKEKKTLKEVAVKEYKANMGIGAMGMGENVYMVDEATRQKLLEGLKENWNELSKQFLKLPVLTDTLPKIRRKMMLEQKIDQLERDVKLVESHPYIYLERHDHRTRQEIVAEGIRLKQEQLERKKKEKERKLKEKEEEKKRQEKCAAGEVPDEKKEGEEEREKGEEEMKNRTE